MLSAMTLPIAFTVPLISEAHQIARQLSSRQLSHQRAKRVYLNSLAVYATQFYLKCMEIEAEDFFECDASRPTVEEFSSLEIAGIGKLECCPVLAGDRTVRLPEETWGDRIGYIAVQFDPSLTQANLLGFLEKTTTEIVELDRLESLETFLRYIDKLEASLQESDREPVKLSHWWNDIVEVGWETLESLFLEAQFAWRDRGGSTSIERDSVMRAKVLDLETSNRVVLAIELRPIDRSEVTILIQLCPFNSSIYLPENLKLSVLDELGTEVIQAEARTTENIQVKFNADLGEKFGIRVALEEIDVVEYFLT
jgi:Protein of unknown function (DUF1822)